MIKKKILYLENVASINAVNFYKTAAMAAQECGMEFHVAYNAADQSEEKIRALYQDLGVYFHQVDFVRNPFHPLNYRAYKQVCQLIKKVKIDFIHCNTPIGGVIGRLAGKKCKVKKVIYQAHGFHFYKGAPLKNWILYYPVERWLAHYTDAIITINTEDYNLAKEKLHLKNNGGKYYVPGVGIDEEVYRHPSIDRDSMRQTMDVQKKEILLISVGRLDENKNNEIIIRALAQTSDIKLVICGDGEQMKYLRQLSEQLGISNRVLFLGNRNDIVNLYHAADVFVMMSFREGLSRSVMEAMAAGLPCIVSDIRGNRDLIIQNKNGILCSPTDVTCLSANMKKLAKNSTLRENMAHANVECLKNYSTKSVIKKMIEIYQTIEL